MRRFYLRRSLRIFPLYYLVLFSVIAIDPRPRPWLAWYATYTTNFAIAIWGWTMVPLAYLWTLAVEEQFYMAWPLLVLLCPPNRFKYVLYGVVAIGPLSRFLVCLATGTSDSSIVITPSCLDSLGLGAILAWLSSSEGGLRGLSVTRFSKVCLAIGLPIVLLDAVYGLYRLYLPAGVAARWFGANLVFVWVIAGAGVGFKNLAGTLLGCRPMRFLGVISYGMYVYHPLVLKLTSVLMLKVFHVHLGLESLAEPVKTVVVCLLTILVSSVSWLLFEKPLNDLKDRVATTPTVPARVGPEEEEAVVAQVTVTIGDD